MVGVISSWSVARKKQAKKPRRPANDDAERQIHPIGTLITVDDDWRSNLEEALERKEMSQRELARRVGVTPATISNLVTGRHAQARKSLVGAIHAALGWGPPIDNAVVDDAYQRIVEGAREISASDRETVARLIASLKKPPANR